MNIKSIVCSFADIENYLFGGKLRIMQFAINDSEIGANYITISENVLQHFTRFLTR